MFKIAKDSHEPVWHMPILKQHEKELKGQLSDMSSTGTVATWIIWLSATKSIHRILSTQELVGMVVHVQQLPF